MNKKLNIAAAIAIVTLLFSLSFINFSSSLYFDSEVSKENSFFATSLDFSLRDFEDVLINPPLFNDSDITSGYNSVKKIRLKKDGASDFKYIATFNKTAGDDLLCNALNLKAELGGVTKYNGSLTAFTLVPEVTIGTLGQDDWTLTLSLDNLDSSILNTTCNFELKFKGSQVISDGAWGYINEESVSNIITSSSVASLAPNNLPPEPTLPVIETEPTPPTEVLPTPTEEVLPTSEPTPSIVPTIP